MNKTIIAMVIIAILEVIAMLTHTNGVTLSAAIAAIAGLGGFALRGYLKK